VTLKEILALSKEAVDHAKAGEIVAAGKKFVRVQDALLDIAADFGFKADPGDEEAKAQIAVNLGELSAVLASPPVRADEPVGKLGDGKIIKFLIDAFIKILPLLL
jgi:hypothetical protein